MNKHIFILFGLTLLIGIVPSVYADSSVISGTDIVCNSNYLMCDLFNDASVDAALWRNSITTCTEAGGELSCPNAGGSGTGYTFRTANAYTIFNDTENWCIEIKEKRSTAIHYTYEYVSATAEHSGTTVTNYFHNDGTYQVQSDGGSPTTINNYLANTYITNRICHIGGKILNTTSFNDTTHYAYENKTQFNMAASNRWGLLSWVTGNHILDYFIAWKGNASDAPYFGGTASNFQITAKDNLTLSNINIFNATINTTLYQTTNGTIVADILSNSSYLFNISVNAYNYNHINFTNYNVSSNLIASLDYKFYKLNISAMDKLTLLPINTFTLNISGNQTIIKTTTNGSIYEELPPNVNYTIGINSSGYLPAQAIVLLNTSNQTYIFNLSGFGIHNCSSSISNTTVLNISFLDINTNIPVKINGSLQATGQSNFQTNLLDIYSYKICIFPDYGNLSETVTIQYAPFGTFSSFSYSTYLNNITQFLTFYTQSSATNSVIFTVKDKDLGTLIENSQVIMQRLIGGIWTTVEQRTTDNTGRVQFNYESNIQYRVLVSKTGYTSQTLTYNPILFSSYDIALVKTTLINNVPDFNGITYSYNPKIFLNGSNAFNFTIQTPFDFLNSYGYILQWCNNATSSEGTSPGGSYLSSIYSINCTSPSYLYVHYWYNTNESGTRNFTDKYNIIFPYGNYTWMALKDKDYGMGLFERIVILTFISIIIVGIAAMAGQAYAGLFLAICVYGFFTYTGFIPIWFCLIMVIPALILIAGKGY